MYLTAVAVGQVSISLYLFDSQGTKKLDPFIETKLFMFLFKN